MQQGAGANTVSEQAGADTEATIDEQSTLRWVKQPPCGRLTKMYEEEMDRAD